MFDIEISNELILLSMIFLHIVDDYYLQGILAKMKQKNWWEKQTTNKKYKYDYIIALFEHAFSWTFVVFIPLFIINKWNIFFFIGNLIIHAFIDNLKANKLKINLIQDQFVHFIQIILTWLFLIKVFN